MKARLVKRGDMLQLLLCNGEVKTLTLPGVKRFFCDFQNEAYYHGGSWDHEISMEEFEGETLAFVSDEGTLTVYTSDFLYAVIEAENVPYLSVAEYAEKHDKKCAMIRRFCANNRIRGAIRSGGVWLIPEDAPYPADARLGKRIVPENE